MRRNPGVSEYVGLIKAVMMQESGGRGTDPMQASECSFKYEVSEKAKWDNRSGVLHKLWYLISYKCSYNSGGPKSGGCGQDKTCPARILFWYRILYHGRLKTTADIRKREP